MRGSARLIQDPLFLVDLQGAVLDCNKGAKALIGGDPASSGAPAFVVDESFRSLFSAASGTSEPVTGAVTLRGDGNAGRRFRARAVVTERSGPALRFAVQILDTNDDRFAALSNRVKELNREIAQRRSAQAQLEEALARNGILYRELQHRVKNHLQMMLGLFSAARREVSTPEELALLQRMEAKLQAISEAQQLMYALDEPSGVPAKQFLSSIVKVIARIAPDGVEIVSEADPATIPNDIAFPLALIANELLSNAVKYGVSGSGGRIEASLRAVADELELSVRDHGPGFVVQETRRRSSGLGLVRGLCRQIGGRLDIASDNGTRVAVRFSMKG